ncbi:MAG: hypothetical protein Q7J29_02240 [Stagnimonas sp.]|nr:hypothetical protein [Stagnimonas sp.]
MLQPEHATAEKASLAATPCVLVDALNVAYWSGNPPSLRLPLALMTQLLADGHRALMVFDASAPHQLKHEHDLYRQLLQHSNHCIETPSGRSADGVLLRLARLNAACIVSRDHYRDHRRRYRKLIDDASRLHAGWVRDGCIHVPSLALSAPLAASTEAAFQQLCRQLQSLPSINSAAAVASGIRLPSAEAVT